MFVATFEGSLNEVLKQVLIEIQSFSGIIYFHKKYSCFIMYVLVIAEILMQLLLQSPSGQLYFL